jgi:hypothetical protein
MNGDGTFLITSALDIKGGRGTLKGWILVSEAWGAKLRYRDCLEIHQNLQPLDNVRATIARSRPTCRVCDEHACR